MKKEDKNSKINKKDLFIGLIAILLILFTISWGVIHYYLRKIKVQKITKEDVSVTDVSKFPLVSENGGNVRRDTVKNILLLGVDDQEKASDSNIILSIDETSKQIKLSSIMRDTYIYYGKDKVNKLNYAYHYGGPQLAIKTINEKFKLDITDYIMVNFAGLTKIIDRIGGVEIDVKQNEVGLLNKYAKNISIVDKTEYTPISNSGKQILNGQQATAYCRIRYVGNQDYERTERQRRVLEQIFEKVKDKPITEYPLILNDIAPNITTSLDNLQIITLASRISILGKNGIKETRCPYDGLKSDAIINGTYYMKWNEEENVKKLHRFIYSY